MCVTIDDYDAILEKEEVKIEIIKPGEFVVTGIEGNFGSNPGDDWIKKGWQRLHKMIKQKGYSVKCPARYFEEVLDPSKPGYLRLALYLEIE